MNAQKANVLTFIVYHCVFTFVLSSFIRLCSFHVFISALRSRFPARYSQFWLSFRYQGLGEFVLTQDYKCRKLQVGSDE